MQKWMWILWPSFLVAGIAEESNIPTAQPQQVRGGIVPSAKVVAAHGKPGLAFQYGAPAHEMRALRHQLHQPAGSIEQTTDAQLIAGGPIAGPAHRCEIADRGE